MRLILGISGSIAAYKCPDLIRSLKKQSIDVVPVLTQSALSFVTKTSLQTVAENEVFTSLGHAASEISHLKIAKESDALLVAPATANFLAKAAAGIADDLLSTLFLAFQGPKLVAPAMHTEMWDNPATKRNIRQLVEDGVQVIGPAAGDLASGDFGPGRFVDPHLLLLALQCLGQDKVDLSGRAILVTAGGTTEAIDTVRTLSNSSTGQLGETIAHIAGFWGATVTLLTSKAATSNPDVKQIPVVSVADLQQALEGTMPEHDTLIMAAAVSDYTVAKSQTKIPRHKTLKLTLEGTPDLLANLAVRQNDKTFVGFCLAEDKLLDTAKSKMVDKGVDMMVANRAAAIGASRRTVHILHRDGRQVDLTDATVTGIAAEILRQMLVLTPSGSLQ